MPGNIGPLEIGIVLIVALLVFGPKRLPELGKSVGKGMREFKDSVTGDPEKPARVAAPVAATPPVATEEDAEIVGERTI